MLTMVTKLYSVLIIIQIVFNSTRFEIEFSVCTTMHVSNVNQTHD